MQGIEAQSSDECSQSLWHFRTTTDIRNNLCTGENKDLKPHVLIPNLEFKGFKMADLTLNHALGPPTPHAYCQ